MITFSDSAQAFLQPGEAGVTVCSCTRLARKSLLPKYMQEVCPKRVLAPALPAHPWCLAGMLGFINAYDTYDWVRGARVDLDLTCWLRPQAWSQ